MAEALGELVQSGQLVELVLALVALEAAALLVYRFRTGRGPEPLGLVFNLAAGSALMLALRAALQDAGWTHVAAFLVLALAAHLADLARRWQR
ncbi:MAG: hypothetical protein ING44_04500 [Telmatospirillum sp.]|nr:hypothetical protein [Telmatospirillum sp.]